MWIISQYGVEKARMESPSDAYEWIEEHTRYSAHQALTEGEGFEIQERSVSCPDGHVCSEAQAVCVWQFWRALVPVALARGEGVEITWVDGVAFLSTVYAPQGERVYVEVRPDGSARICSEPSAPRIAPDMSLQMPWTSGERVA